MNKIPEMSFHPSKIPFLISKTLFQVFLLILIIDSCKNVSEPDLTIQEDWNLHIIDSTLYGADGIRKGYFNDDSLMDFIVGGEEYGATRVYLGLKNGGFEQLEFPSPDVEDAIFYDINKDGKQEVFTFSEGKSQYIGFHFLDSNDHWKYKKNKASAGVKWMYGAVADLDNDNSKEIVVGAKGENGMIAYLKPIGENPDSIDWKLEKVADAGWIMSIECIDLNFDGQLDILVSDRKGIENTGVKWYKNPGDNTSENSWEEQVLGLSGKEPMFLTLTDFNNDGLEDMLVAEIHEGVFLLERETQESVKFRERKLFEYPDFVGGRGKSVACLDLNGDGINEIITSYEEAEDKFGLIASKFIEQNKEWNHLKLSSIKGIKYDKILPHDMDNDGDLDLLITEERENKNGLGVIWYENPNKNK